MKQYKKGHEAPIGFRVNRFSSIELEGDFAYCKSHNFVYNTEIEKEKLYNGQACYYTDTRFIDTIHNFYQNCYLHLNRNKETSLKACIRKTLNIKNIPRGTIVSFKKSWYYPKFKFTGSFNFKIKKENNFDIQYEINKQSYFNNFTTCEFSKKLTNALRENGFIVSITKNESFLNNMLNSAIMHTGQTNFVDSEIKGETAIAYGHGKKIGFSSFKNDFMGYSNGCKNILWDHFGEFNKWSQSNEISKTTSIEDIINILKQPNAEY